jgi:hypothetical protein
MTIPTPTGPTRPTSRFGLEQPEQAEGGVPLMKTAFQPGRLCAVLLSAGLSSGFFTPRAHALTLQEAYALKGSGKVAAELLLSASGAPKGDVVVSALAQPGQAEKLLAQLNALGLEHGAAAGRLVTGRLPLAAVRKLDPLASLHSIRPSQALFHAASDPGAGRQGAIVSQGDTEMHAASARTRFQIDGTGVKVGVLSNSYDCNPNGIYTAAASIRAGELPQDVQVLADLRLRLDPVFPQRYYRSRCDPYFDEGRTLLEIVHDLAPGASLAFHTAKNGAIDMANGIRELAEAGTTVIVDDTVYLDEPVYQDGGVIVDAVRDVIARGVTYVAAAGNFGRLTYEAPFRPSGVTQTIQGRTVEFHDFDPGPGVDTCQKVTFEKGTAALALHWNQPYASIGGGPGATSDLDLFLMDENCKQVAYFPNDYWVSNVFKTALIGVAATDNIGGDPVETLIMYAGAQGSAGIAINTYGIAVGYSAGPIPDRVRITYAGSEREKEPPETAEYTKERATIFGHPNLPEVITVGAILGPPGSSSVFQRVEEFSALGGGEILFDAKGNPLPQPIQRLKPDVAGSDGAKTFNWQFRLGSPIFGTSVAAAHVGALVALAKQAVPEATPTQIAEALRATAQDLDDTLTPAVDTGFDFATGYGLADAENLIATLKGEPLAPRKSFMPSSKPTPSPPNPTDGNNQDLPNPSPTPIPTPPVLPAPTPPPVLPASTPKEWTACTQPIAFLSPGAWYRGTKGNDIVLGAWGNETVKGLQGSDTLCGEAGADKLDGGPGNDVIEGGPGNDVLTGGPGADVFRFSGASSTGVDRIMDLGRGDVIEIVGLQDANGDGKIDSADLSIADTPTGAVITALRSAPGTAERILVRGRKAARVIQALRFSS